MEFPFIYLQYFDSDAFFLFSLCTTIVHFKSNQYLTKVLHEFFRNYGHFLYIVLYFQRLKSKWTVEIKAGSWPEEASSLVF